MPDRKELTGKAAVSDFITRQVRAVERYTRSHRASDGAGDPRLRVARVTTKRIAEIAGVAEGTIFRHFDSKNDLLLAALQRRGIPKLEMPGLEAAGFGTVRDNLARAGHFVLRYSDVIPSIVAALADVGLLPDHRKWFQEHPFGGDRLAETVHAYVAREQLLGRVRANVDSRSLVARKS
jgi:AcrR family transcriptional regulator